MRILAGILAVCAIAVIMISCSDSNPGESGTPLSTTLTELTLGTSWYGITYDTTFSDTISQGRSESIFRSNGMSRYFDTVTDVKNIQNQIYLVVKGFDTVIDPLTGNAGLVKASTTYFKSNDTMLGYLVMPSWLLWDTLEVKALKLPFSIGNSWPVINVTKDTTFKYLLVFPAKAHEEFAGTGTVTGTTMYQAANANYESYTVSVSFSPWIVITSDTTVLNNGKAIEAGDTVVTYSGHNISTLYISPNFATTLWSSSISTKADSNYIDTTKAMVRDTVRSCSYITRYYNPVTDSMYSIR